MSRMLRSSWFKAMEAALLAVLVDVLHGEAAVIGAVRLRAERGRGVRGGRLTRRLLRGAACEHEERRCRGAERRAADEQRGSHHRQQPELDLPHARLDPRQASCGRMGLDDGAHARPRSRRKRTSPIWSWSPKPMAVGPATGRPLT